MLRLLDLFCGAGGAAMGYYRAGFDVTGVDIKPQPHFPFTFIQADALEYVAEHGHEYDAIHASPPCQYYSVGTPDRSRHWDSVPVTRRVLQTTGKPWVIENVPGSPLRADFMLTGDMVGLPLLKRQRLFETNWNYQLVLCNKMERVGPVYSVTGHGSTSGNRATWGRSISIAEWRLAMGIDWMNGDELSQAIPPAYTEWVGRQLIVALGTANGGSEE